MLEGDPVDQLDGRNNTLQALTSYLAYKFKETPTETFLALLAPSISVMAEPEGVEYWQSVAENMLERAEADRERDAAEAQKFKEEMEASRRQASALPGESSEPYTEAEVGAWAKAADCTREEFNRRWVIQCNSNFFFLRNGRYDYPLPAIAAENDMCVALARAENFVPLTVPTQKGERKRKLTEIVQEHGTVVPRVAYTYLRSGSYFDSVEKTLLLGAAPQRKITPRFSPQIQRWLELTGASDPERFFDWLATLPDLTKPTCALYVRGPRGNGKNMLYLGLARLWSKTGPVMLTTDHFTSWNDDMLRCPLLVVDEAMPGASGEKSLDGYMRQLITAESRPLRRRNMDGATLEGAQRVILVANKDDLLAFSDDMTNEALEATAERYFYLRCDDEPSKYLASLGGRQATESWVAGDEIAAHVLHLRDTRKVKPYGRLLVSGRLSEMRSKLAASSGLAPHACEFILKSLKDDKYRDQFLRVGNGKVLINALVMTDKARWEGMVPSAKVPSVQRASEALKAISVSDRQLRVREKGGHKRYYELDLEILKDKAEELQLMDRSEIDAYTARVIKEELA
jgi:hypothetical protein